MASYNYTFQSGDGVTPTRLNDARTVSEIVNADIKSDAAIAGTKISPNFGSQNVVTTGTLAAGLTEISSDVSSVGISIRGRSSDNIAAISFNNSAGNAGSQVNFINSIPNNRLVFATNNTERMRIDASGNVGIGIAPTRKLDVLIDAAPAASQSSKTGLLIRNNNTTGTGGSPNSAAIQFAFDPNTPTGFIECATYGNNFMSFGHGGAERMRIDASGNVGIGNTSPSVKLDVTGDINCSSAYGVDGVQVVANRRTGWTAATGTATRTTFATSTVSTAQLAERVKALIDDLSQHGLIGS